MERKHPSDVSNPAVPQSADEAFVAALQDGDPRALDSLAAECARDLLPQLRSRLRRGARLAVEAEDVLQDAFVKAFARLDDFQGGTLREFQTWLYRIALNRLFDVFRAARREREREGRVVFTDLTEVEETGEGLARPAVGARSGAGADAGPAAAGLAADPEEAARQLMLDGARCVAESEPGQREALVMRDLQALPWESLEFLTGRTPEGTKSLYYRARRAARERAELDGGAGAQL